MRRIAVIVALLGACLAGRAAADPVRFPSGDGKTSLVGYLSLPRGDGPFPAIVLLHGRAGPYSSLANGTYTEATLARRHATWAEFWVRVRWTRTARSPTCARGRT